MEILPRAVPRTYAEIETGGLFLGDFGEDRIGFGLKCIELLEDSRSADYGLYLGPPRDGLAYPTLCELDAAAEVLDLGTDFTIVGTIDGEQVVLGTVDSIYRVTGLVLIGDSRFLRVNGGVGEDFSMCHIALPSCQLTQRLPSGARAFFTGWELRRGDDGEAGGESTLLRIEGAGKPG